MSRSASGLLAPLVEARYRALFAAYCLMLTGSVVASAAYVWNLVEISGGALSLGISFMLGCAGLVVAGPVGGSLADRVQRRWVVFVCQAVLALTALLLSVALALGTATAAFLLAVAAIEAVVLGFLDPARESIWREVVTPERFPESVRLNQSAGAVITLAGPFLALALIEVVGAWLCFAINVACTARFAAVALRVGWRRRPPAPAHSPRPTWREILRRRRLWRVVGVSTLIANSIGAYLVAIPSLAGEGWPGSTAVLALVTSATAAGGLVGTLASARLRRAARARDRRLVIAGVALVGGATLVAAHAGQLALLVLALLVAGAGIALASSTLAAIVKELAEERVAGRVMAVFALVHLPVAALAAGALSDATSPRVVLLVTGVLGLVLAAIAAVHGAARARRAGTAPAADQP